MEADAAPPLAPALIARFTAIVGDRNCIWRSDDLRTYECDALTSFRARPGLVVLPASRAEVVDVVRLARCRCPAGSSSGCRA
jgi:glycolate oxidase